MVKLQLSALPTLPGSVAVLQYGPRALTYGIVHFGVGGLSPLAPCHVYRPVPQYGRRFRVGDLRGGGAARRRLHSRLFAAQDNLYTLVIRSSGGESQARVIGAIREFLFAPDDPRAVLEKLAASTMQIVSLTITEGGYDVNNVTARSTPSGADIQHDLTAGATPRTVFSLPNSCCRSSRSSWRRAAK